MKSFTHSAFKNITNNESKLQFAHSLFNFQLQWLLLFTALVDSLQCYTSSVPSDDNVQTCTECEWCVTVQHHYGDPKHDYERGCGCLSDTIPEDGCLITTIEGNPSMCFKSCQTDKCNSHTELYGSSDGNGSSSAMATGSCLVAFIYMIMWFLWHRTWFIIDSLTNCIFIIFINFIENALSQVSFLKQIWQKLTASCSFKLSQIERRQFRGVNRLTPVKAPWHCSLQ